VITITKNEINLKKIFDCYELKWLGIENKSIYILIYKLKGKVLSNILFSMRVRNIIISYYVI